MHLTPLVPVLVLLTGCTLLEEQRDAPTEVPWSGWVLVDLPSQGTTDVLTDGTVEFLDVDGAQLASASQPYEGSPGYWEATVPVDTEVAVRVAGPEDAETPLATMVWRGRSPSGRGLWLEGALLTRELSYFDEFFAFLDDIAGLDPQDLADGEIAHLWCEPMDPGAWTDATIEVTGADGEPSEVVAFAIDDDGMLVQRDTGPIDIFVALDLPEGTTTMDVTTAAGTAVTTSWPTRGGELLSAIYYVLPEE